MRDQLEVQKAHDLFVGVAKGDAPNPFQFEDTALVIADVLCWVLEHTHNKTFQTNFERAESWLEGRGFSLHRIEEGEV